LAIFSKKRKISQFTIGEKVAKKIPKILCLEIDNFFQQNKKKRKHWSGALWAIVPKEFRKKGKTL
jgi:hypothetical protein